MISDMTGSGDEEEEKDTSLSSFLSPPSGIATPLTTTQHCDDHAIAPATKTKMAASSGTLCPSEPDKDTKIHVTLGNDSLWQEFHGIGTEMLLTRKGRRMFPFCRYTLTGLDPQRLYFLVMDFQLVDEHRYRWTGWGRLRDGPSEALKAGSHTYTHPSSPAAGSHTYTHPSSPAAGSHTYTHPSSPTTGSKWMQDQVAFSKVKLTNDLLDDDSFVMLHFNRRYIPRLHVVPFDPSRGNTINIDDPTTQTFTFPQTEFYAVSGYQNPQLTELKIRHNPFASAFRHEEMHPGKHMQLPAGGDHESRVSPDSNHGKGNKRAKRRLSLPTAGEFGLGASPVLKKKMAGGLTRTEEMLSTEDESRNHGARPSPSCSKRRAPAKMKRRVTIPRVPTHTSTSTPRTLKRPALTSPKGPKTLLHKRKTNSRKNAKGSGVVTETPSEPAVVTHELAVDDVEGMLFVSFANKESHDTHVPLKRELQESHDTHVPLRELQESHDTHVPLKRELQESHDTHVPLKRELQESHDTHVPLRKLQESHDTHVLLKRELQESHDTHVPLKRELQESDDTHVPLKREMQESDDTHVPLKREMQESDDTHVPLKREPPPSPLLNCPPVLQLQEATRATEPEKATEEVLQERIVQLEKTLLVDLGSFKYRQVVHPALRQVGLKLNLVDPEVAIDLQYLGVTLPLPPLIKTSAALCADGTIPFVSRTGKTDDLTKIKGWRDKYSSSSELPHITPQEGPVKVHSAFSSEMLDEYLENEAQRITERAETFSFSSFGSADPVAAGVAYQLPSRSSSYVRTLDSVLKGRSTATLAPSPVPPLSSTHAPSPVPPLSSTNASLGTSRYGGFTKPQCHLQAMERQAFCQGHTETYVTKERATIALGVLLTAQGSVKADRVDLARGDMLGACQRDFCRLGCVCLSLLRQPRPPTHCRRPQCMFECVCFRHRVLLIRPHPDKSSSSSSSAHRAEKNKNTDLKLLAYPISNPDKGLRPAPGRRVPLLWEGRADEEDPEPLFKPQKQKQCVSNARASLSAPSKPANKRRPNGPRVKEEDKSSPVYKYFDSMMTCARVRPINSMPPPQMHILPGLVTNRAKEKHLQSPETSVPVVHQQSLENEVPSTKLLQIVSECNWEPHRELVLSTLSRRLSLNLLTPSFTLGFYRVRLLSVTQHRRQSHCTITYKLSISRGDGTRDKQHLPRSQKPRPKQPLRPGYLKALRLRPGVSPKRLVEVNGKHYAKARLMLGRMGALHPVNRLAAFVTGRLVTFPGSSDASVEKDAVPGPLVDAPPQGPSASQLLYIPIGSPDGAAPPAPATPTQNGMLKPVVGAQKGALYRQPNGQLVRLVPLKTLKAMKSTSAPSPAPGTQNGLPTPSGPCPENGASGLSASSSASQDRSTDTAPTAGTGTDTPPIPPDSSSAAVAKPFSLSGKSTMRISQGSAAIRTLPRTGSFSFPLLLSAVLPLPGGFSLVQRPTTPAGEVKVAPPGVLPLSVTAATTLQATDRTHGTLKKGSQNTGTLKKGSQNTGTSVEERRKVVAPVVVPPMASRTLQNNAAAVPPQATRRVHRGSKLRGPGEGAKTVVAPVVFPPTLSRTPHHSVAERERCQLHQTGFRRLKEVLCIKNIKVTKQDILDQAKLVISALKTREKKLEKKKAFMTRTQSDYIKTISQMSGKTEEMIKKKLEEISKRQRLLEQYRQRLNEKNPVKAQLKLTACDRLTERFAIWKHHMKKRTFVTPPPTTGEEAATGTPKTSRRPDVKARDSPELRAALLNSGNTAPQVNGLIKLSSSGRSDQNAQPCLLGETTQLGSSSQRSSPSNSGTQGGEAPNNEELEERPSLDADEATDRAERPSLDADEATDREEQQCADEATDREEQQCADEATDRAQQPSLDADEATDRAERPSLDADEATDRAERPSLDADEATDREERPSLDADEATDRAEQQCADEATDRAEQQCADEATDREEQQCADEATDRAEQQCADEATDRAEQQCADEATDRAQQQCADEAAAVALTSEESSKVTVCAALLSSLVVENGVPKPRRGRPPKQAKAAPSLLEAKTRPPPPQKVKHSPRLHPEGRQLRSRSPALGRAHTRRGQRRGRI
ncbi:MAX gene-associated protein-like isoform X2 [Clupea harengus]|uniref:MAX gene-associated protein-like isoform X2 n=1 Tax=Clupea harengus TaxID=7950 RepID=A0A8M1KT32_CLUHA|nr:MAX gene-associated protein-like isoform X2 [Clupea harengus]